MGKNSEIEWTDHTWNPWVGCEKVSPGCKNCYMFSGMRRFGRHPEQVERTKPTTFEAPLKWRKSALVFTCSWSDFFIEKADAWRSEAWEIIARTQHLNYLILTKRPERIRENLPKNWGAHGYYNVWLGVSVESAKCNWRLDILSEIPCTLRFASYEPMLGWCDFRAYYNNGKLDWVIAGGESGQNARQIDERWMKVAVMDAKTANSPVFVKQMGTGWAKSEHLHGDSKGAKPENIPIDFRYRQFPNRNPCPDRDKHGFGNTCPTCDGRGYIWIPGEKSNVFV